VGNNRHRIVQGWRAEGATAIYAALTPVAESVYDDPGQRIVEHSRRLEGRRPDPPADA
jgi:hypothetical protein